MRLQVGAELKTTVVSNRTTDAGTTMQLESD